MLRFFCLSWVGASPCGPWSGFLLPPPTGVLRLTSSAPRPRPGASDCSKGLWFLSRRNYVSEACLALPVLAAACLVFPGLLVGRGSKYNCKRKNTWWILTFLIEFVATGFFVTVLPKIFISFLAQEGGHESSLLLCCIQRYVPSNRRVPPPTLWPVMCFLGTV